MTTKIAVSGIECYAYHGCMEEEARIGGNFRVDILIEKDVQRAIESDILSETVDYVVVNKIVREQMAIRSKLIEHVAGRILKSLNLTFPGPKVVEVKVTKINPPVNSQIAEAAVTLTEVFK